MSEPNFQDIPNYKPKKNEDFMSEGQIEHFKEKLSAWMKPLRTGVARLFSEARKAGLRLAIATTTTPANVDALITHTLGADALDWFEVIGAGDIVPNLKPAGDALNKWYFCYAH
jgi:phosphoglycolate phosphatase-like HAD superfamily hydrolase